MSLRVKAHLGGIILHTDKPNPSQMPLKCTPGLLLIKLLISSLVGRSRSDASYECPDCGWQERIVLKATNKRLSVREVEIICEAIDEKNDAST